MDAVIEKQSKEIADGENPCSLCDCSDYVYDANNDLVCARSTCQHGSLDHGIG